MDERPNKPVWELCIKIEEAIKEVKRIQHIAVETIEKTDNERQRQKAKKSRKGKTGGKKIEGFSTIKWI